MSEPALKVREVSPTVRRILPLLIGLAVGIRVALAMVHTFTFPDSGDYDALARAMLEGRPYEVGGNLASRMPGYPVLVAAVYAVAGYSVRAVLVVQGLLGLPIVCLTYLLARRHSLAAGLVAAALVTFDPLTIGFSDALLTETPFTLCLLMALWLGVRLIERPTWRGWVALGVVWGIGVTMRASALWCIVPLGMWVSVASGSMRRVQRVAGPVVAVALTFAILMPWLVRNYGHFGSGPLRLTTLEGISLYEAVYPEADGGPRQDKIELPADMRPLNEAQRNDEWSRRAWGYIRAEPLRMARLGVAKIGRTWSPTFNTAQLQSPALLWGMRAWYIPLFALAALGVVTAGLRRGQKVLFLVPIVYFTLVHALFLGSVRYRVPLMPVVCVFAALGVTSLWARFQGRKRTAEVAV